MTTKKATEDEVDAALELIDEGTELDDDGQLESALACYDRALALDPTQSLAWSNRGNTLLKLGRVEIARTSYDRALELDGSDSRALLGAWMCRRPMAAGDTFLDFIDRVNGRIVALAGRLRSIDGWTDDACHRIDLERGRVDWSDGDRPLATARARLLCTVADGEGLVRMGWAPSIVPPPVRCDPVDGVPEVQDWDDPSYVVYLAHFLAECVGADGVWATDGPASRVYVGLWNVLPARDEV